MSDDRTGLPGLLMTLPARPQNVPVVRHAVAGLAEQLGMAEQRIGDLKTVVTEACMNVVAHAYEGEPGPLQVEVTPDDDELTVCVRDFGQGIRPRPDLEHPSLRLGLTLIAALSSSFEISGGLGRGTEIRLRLPLRGRGAGRAAPRAGGAVPLQHTAELMIGREDLVAPVLARVVGALAARHQITVDRLSDAVLFTDAISAQAPHSFSDGHFRFAVADGPDGVDLRVGPLPAGDGERMREGLALPGLEGSLATLADELRVEEGEAGEYLIARFAALPG